MRLSMQPPVSLGGRRGWSDPSGGKDLLPACGLSGDRTIAKAIGADTAFAPYYSHGGTEGENSNILKLWK